MLRTNRTTKSCFGIRSSPQCHGRSGCRGGNARKLLKSDASVENIVLYTDVIAQKLMNNISLTSYDENDKEIAALLDRAEDMKGRPISMTKAIRSAAKSAKAEEYRMQASNDGKRIINWLTPDADVRR